jgi:hypothetical protein
MAYKQPEKQQQREAIIKEKMMCCVFVDLDHQTEQQYSSQIKPGLYYEELPIYLIMQLGL